MPDPKRVVADRATHPPRRSLFSSIDKELLLMTHGMRIFRSVPEALRAGFHIYDRVPKGYIARAKVNDRWVMALIELTGAWN
jgi:hypothetical protein